MRFTFRRSDSASLRLAGRTTTFRSSLRVTSSARIGSAMASQRELVEHLRPAALAARRWRPRAVGARLDHGGPPAAPRLVRGRFRDRVDREQIVPVDADAVEAVRQSLLGKSLRGGLAGDRDGDGPLVVLAEEDRRGLEDAREVHRGVEVALARGAVAEVRERDDVLLADLRGPCRADGLRDLRADRAGDRHVVDIAGPVVVRHLPALLRILGVSIRLSDQRRDGEASPQGGPRLPIRREDPVPLLEGHRAAYLGRLLSGAWNVESDPPLPLEGEHPVVQRADEDEVSVRALQEVRRDPRLELRIVGAVGVDDPEKPFFGRALTPPELACAPEGPSPRR